jgi:hypothetical protein
MTATSPVSTAQLRMRISRHLKNHGERLVQSPDGRWCVVNAHDGLVVRGQHLWWLAWRLKLIRTWERFADGELPPEPVAALPDEFVRRPRTVSY